VAQTGDQLNNGQEGKAGRHADDTIAILAATIGLDAGRVFPKWLTLIDDPILVWENGNKVPKTLRTLLDSDVIVSGQRVAVPNVVAALWLGDGFVVGEWFVNWEPNLDYLKDLGFNVYAYERKVIPKKEHAEEVLTQLKSYLQYKQLQGLFVVGHGDRDGFGTGWSKLLGKWYIRYRDLEDYMGTTYRLAYVHMNTCEGIAARRLLSGSSSRRFLGKAGIVWPTGFANVWNVFLPGDQATDKAVYIPGT
jgi:hypothetical protein